MKKSYLLMGALALCSAVPVHAEDAVSLPDYTKILMLGSPSADDMKSNDTSRADDDEMAAYRWFIGHDGATYASATEVKEGSKSLDGYDAVWVVLDREVGKSNPDEFVQALRDSNDPMFSDEVIAVLTSYHKAGGKLLLTNHAAVLLKEIGRHTHYPYSLNSFGSGSARENSDVWYARVSYLNYETNPVNDKSGDRIYKGIKMEIMTDQVGQPYKCFPLIGGGSKEDHNCFFTIDVENKEITNDNVQKYKEVRDEFGVEYLAVWPHITDICSCPISRWLPKDDYDGVAIAIGFGGYEWHMNIGTNPYQVDIEKLTENALAELTDNTIDYGHVVGPEPPKPVDDNTLLLEYTMDKNGNKVHESVADSDYDIRGHFYESVSGAMEGNALRLDGYSSFVEGGAMNDVIINKMTAEVWCAAETYPMGTLDMADEGWAAIAENRQDNNGWSWELSSRGRYRFGFSVDGNWQEVMVDGKFPKYKWNHLVAKVDAENGNVKIYNNGQLVAEKPFSKGMIKLGNGTVVIGKSRNSAEMYGCLINAFNGIVDHISLRSGLVEVEKPVAYTDEYLNAPELFVSETRYEGNILRPKFHAVPAANWGNETHGLYYDEATQLYHMFYQKNANGHYLSHMHWGHMISNDMVKWTEINTAIDPSEDYDWKGCWSGCLFRDDDFNDGMPTIFYTGVNNADPHIIQALPSDREKDPYLFAWSKQPTGISRPNSGYDFRDPYVFKYDNEFYMIIGSADNNKGALHVHKYDKAAKKWNTTPSIFFSATGHSDIDQGTFWEMPVVVEMDGKWLLTVSTISNDVRAVYWIGSIRKDGDNITFVPDEGTMAPRLIEKKELAGNGHGFLSPTVLKKDGKVYAIGIVPDKLSAEQNCNNGWSHNYSLPREWSIVDGELVQKPFAGLRDKLTDASLKAADMNSEISDLQAADGRLFKFDLELNEGATGSYTLEFFKGNESNKAFVKLDLDNKTVQFNTEGLEKINNGFDANVTASIAEKPRMSTYAVGDGGHLEVFVDHSTVDLFVNDKIASSLRVFPTNAANTGVTFKNNGKQGDVKSMNLFAIDPDKFNDQHLPTSVGNAYADDASIEFALNGKVLTVIGAPGEYEVNLFGATGEKVFNARGVASFEDIALPVCSGLYIMTIESDGLRKAAKILVR